MNKEAKVKNKKMKSKKSMEMAVSTLVIIIISLLVLIGLIVILTSTEKNFVEAIKLYFTSSNLDKVVENCNTLVITNADYEYCCTKKTIKLSSKEKFELSCFEASAKSWGDNIDKLNCEGMC